jgi:hypothetical protein
MKRDPVIFVLAIMVSGCNFNSSDSDSRLLDLLKQESLAVAETITKKSPDSFVVTHETCDDHKFSRVCYYIAKYSFPDISAEELRLMAENTGWSQDPRKNYAKYLTNFEYRANFKSRYCHSLLEVNDDELTLHCYKKKC